MGKIQSLLTCECQCILLTVIG